MNQRYNEFLKSLPIITEDEFDELMELLPDVNIDFQYVEWEGYELGDIEDVAVALISDILHNWKGVYLDEINYPIKTLRLEDVGSLEDLEEIKSFFSKWTITNYDDLEYDLKEYKNENEKEYLLEELGKHLTNEEIKTLVEKYANKTQTSR